VLGYEHNLGSKPMTLPSRGNEKLTDEEFQELDALRKAINSNLASVHPKKQERFTELFVRSLSYVGSHT
jgi:hypothetical protein